MRNTVLFLTCLLCSCSRYPAGIESVLKQAGDNRSELEKVLQHYLVDPVDSLKYKAAVFLIENLPGHYSYKYPELIQAYYNELDTTHWDEDAGKNRETIEQISGKHIASISEETVEDIHILTAGFLIDNIERAFDVWQNGEWATHVSFDDFCEYILPYKGAEMQPIDNWREYTKDMLKADLDDLHYCDLYKNSAFHAATSVSKELIRINRQPYPSGGLKAIPISHIRTLAHLPFGSCDNYVQLALAVMRSKGIPVMADFTPQWPFQAQSHAWNIVLTNQGKNMVFSAGSSNPGELHKPESKMAKVFRNTCATNREIQQIHQWEDCVAPAFNNWFMRDVTDEYMMTCDVEISVPNHLKGKYHYGYLAVFDNKNWIPVHYGKVSGGKVRFEKMGKNCMYLPVFYGKEGIIPFSEPFHITAKGIVEQHKVNKSNRRNMTVFRKYFIAGHCYEVGDRMKGGIFEAANQPDFSDADVIHRIPNFTVQSGEIQLDTLQKSYRYWRYRGPDYSFCNVGELYFYENRNEPPIYGFAIGAKGISSTNMKEAAFDGDPLTLYNAAEPCGGWVGMDFGQPVRIDKISYTPRGDGNDITPGDIHELLYWDKRWVSLGKQQPADVKLIYTNVPAGAIYWIRNHSRGKDERIFTYENGKQVWW